MAAREDLRETARDGLGSHPGPGERVELRLRACERLQEAPVLLLPELRRTHEDQGERSPDQCGLSDDL